MFKDKTAWFSDCVRSDIISFWVSQRGVIADWKAADYLFSEDASCPDTKRIHMSDAYMKDKATVFHSAYLSTCRLRQSTRSVPLGHYLLPPVSVQKEVKSRIGRFIWEQDEMPCVTDSCVNTCPSRDELVCCEAQLYPVNNMISGFVHIDQLRKFSGELHDFLPSHSGYSVSRSRSRTLPYRY